MKYLLIALIGAMAAILANRGIAVFNDGLRPLVPQYFDRIINRRELAAMSFALSFGLVVGYGIPASIAASLILIHCLLLATDIIGTWFPDSAWGLCLAGVSGAAYGLGLLVGLDAVVNFFARLPYNFLGSLDNVSTYVVAAMAVIPGLAAGYQHGFKTGAASVFVTILTYFAFKSLTTFTLAGHTVNLNAAGMAMLVGFLLMLLAAARERGTGNDHARLTAAFSARLARLKANRPLLAVMGGLVAAGTSLGIVVGDPASLALLTQGETTNAVLTAFARAVGFMPLVFTTAIVTGVYAPAGCTFVFVLGLMLPGQTVPAFVGGCLVILLELTMIQAAAHAMDKFPGIKEMGAHIRTAMNQVVELALAVGSVVAAENMAVEALAFPGAGALFVIAAILLNRLHGQGFVEMAIGPVACIAFGILLNILLII